MTIASSDIMRQRYDVRCEYIMYLISDLVLLIKLQNKLPLGNDDLTDYIVQTTVCLDRLT